MDWASRACRLSVICGAAPLLAGVSLLLLWLVTRWGWLVYAGIITLYACLAVLAVGIIALGWFCWLAFHFPAMPGRRSWRSILLSAVLLVANIPMGIGVIAVFCAVLTCYTVVVHNESQKSLGGARVQGGGCDVSFGDIAPGASAKHSFWIQTDGRLEFAATVGGKHHEETIDGYVTGNMGGRTVVTVNSDDATLVNTER